MTWREAMVQLQVEAEERVGKAARAATYQALAEEDVAFKASTEAIRGVRG